MIFCVLLLVMRLLGKRSQNNGLTPMRQMLLIALGSVAGDAFPMAPLLHAALILVGVILLTVALGKPSLRSH